MAIREGYIRDGKTVGCSKCGASVHAFHPDALAKATKRWNARVAPAAPPPIYVWWSDDGQHIRKWSRDPGPAGEPFTPVAVQPDAAGWVVENGGGTRWRTWENGWSAWTDNVDDATRYARREDAEAVHRDDEDAWRVVPYVGAVNADSWTGDPTCPSCHGRGKLGPFVPGGAVAQCGNCWVSRSVEAAVIGPDVLPKDAAHAEGCNHTHTDLWLCDCPRVRA
jgi:hypothetical protein